MIMLTTTQAKEEVKSGLCLSEEVLNQTLKKSCQIGDRNIIFYMLTNVIIFWWYGYILCVERWNIFEKKRDAENDDILCVLKRWSHLQKDKTSLKKKGAQLASLEERAATDTGAMLEVGQKIT